METILIVGAALLGAMLLTSIILGFVNLKNTLLLVCGLNLFCLGGFGIAHSLTEEWDDRNHFERWHDWYKGEIVVSSIVAALGIISFVCGVVWPESSA